MSLSGFSVKLTIKVPQQNAISDNHKGANIFVHVPTTFKQFLIYRINSHSLCLFYSDDASDIWEHRIHLRSLSLSLKSRFSDYY